MGQSWCCYWFQGGVWRYSWHADTLDELWPGVESDYDLVLMPSSHRV